MSMDERKASILRAVVGEYIETAQPVGSGWVARLDGMSVSPATIRKEMMALEEEGYLMQPHTSAGRVPTDQGYRYFVDSLSDPPGFDAAHHEQISEFFSRTRGAIEVMLQGTSRLLANLTDYAAVVVGPAHEDAVIRSVQLVSLGDRSAIVVLVLSNGALERGSIEIESQPDAAVFDTATRHLSELLVGKTLRNGMQAMRTNRTIPVHEDESVAAMCRAAIDALSSLDDPVTEKVFVGGASHMAQAFDAVETVRQVLDTLEQQYLVVSLLQDVLDRGLSVAIGREHGLAPLADCSVVVSPYEIDGERVGAIGVFGPTRMHYPEALTAVALVSQNLGRRLSES